MVKLLGVLFAFVGALLALLVAVASGCAMASADDALNKDPDTGGPRAVIAVVGDYHAPPADPGGTLRAAQVNPDDDEQANSYREYLDNTLLPALQAEPVLPKPVVFSSLRPVPADDPFLDAMVRVCRTVHVDVWTGDEDWANVERLCKKFNARVYLKVMPFQLTKANDPDDRYDLSTPMNNGIWRQLNRLTGLMDKWIDRAGLVESCDLHSELWPWPADDKYGNGTAATKYANRLHRYRAATAIVRSYVPDTQVYWYYYANVQANPGDVWYYDRSANHTNEDPAISDAINPEIYRAHLAAEWMMDYLPVAAGLESGVYTGEATGKPLIPLIGIQCAYDIRSAPSRPEWSRMGGWNWWPQHPVGYPDGNDYQAGKFLFRPGSYGDGFAWLQDRIQHVVLYGSPWYMNGTCQTLEWQCEFYRRFLIFCRGARNADISDLTRPDYASWSNTTTQPTQVNP